MLPKTELRYSWLYNTLFVPGFRKSDLKRLRRSCQTFERLYQKHHREILALIQKHATPWEEKGILIYLVERGSIISDPITIRYERDAKTMLIWLVHELLHRNLQKAKFRNDYRLHAAMNGITRKILNELPIGLYAQFKVLEALEEKLRKKYARRKQ